MKILVVGGAGYIGSHMVKRLLHDRYEITVLDNLSNGHRNAVLGGHFIHGDLNDTSLLREIFLENKFDAVMHFASFIQVGESVERLDIYYQNNLVNTLNLLNAMVEANVHCLVFWLPF